MLVVIDSGAVERIIDHLHDYLYDLTRAGVSQFRYIIGLRRILIGCVQAHSPRGTSDFYSQHSGRQ